MQRVRTTQQIVILRPISVSRMTICDTAEKANKQTKALVTVEKDLVTVRRVRR